MSTALALDGVAEAALASLRWQFPVPNLDATAVTQAERALLATKRVVLLNGPPRAGKDTAAGRVEEVAASLGLSTLRWGMSYHLKLATHSIYGLFDELGRPLPHDAFEASKDIPSPAFGGLSPRQAYILVSETYVKRHHGQSAFGVFWAKRAAASKADVIIAPDAGFAAEWAIPLSALDSSKVRLVRIHAEGRGVTFTDSRSFIDLPQVETLDLDNSAPGETFAFLSQLEQVARILFTSDRTATPSQINGIEG